MCVYSVWMVHVWCMCGVNVCEACGVGDECVVTLE